MGDELKATRELEGIKEQMDLLAEHLEAYGEILDGTLDADLFVCILRGISNGQTAESIIEKYGLDVEV